MTLEKEDTAGSLDLKDETLKSYFAWADGRYYDSLLTCRFPPKLGGLTLDMVSEPYFHLPREDMPPCALRQEKLVSSIGRQPLRQLSLCQAAL